MEMWREAAALCAVFGLLGVAVWTLRARAGGLRTRSGKSLTAVERIVLTPHHVLHLVRAPGREMLVATHPQGCSLLWERPLPEKGLVEPPLMEGAPSLPARHEVS